jgi:uncharacterized membrane protein YhaH (DUF805 family)
MLIAVLTNLPAAGDTPNATDAGLGNAMVFVMGATYLVILILLLPMLAVSVRRLHDLNRSGWFYLVTFIPFAGGIILMVVMCEDSGRGANRYGPSPKYV